MRKRILFIAIASLLVLSGCRQNRGEAGPELSDRANNGNIEYVVDYSVAFAADHDSTMHVTADCNYGIVKVAQIESENLIGADGKLVKNTVIILEDAVPAGKSITLHRGGLLYTGGKPEFVHNHTVGSNDLVELRIQGSDDYTLYSIRDNMFFGPEEGQSFTIAQGQSFSVVLPIMTEQKYPKEKESHTIRIGFVM